jgi:hypothetical protein
MTAIEKLLDRICRNPRDVRFDDACKAAEHLGFARQPSGGGSHTRFKRLGEITQLNFQNRSGKVPAYQAEQLIEMIERYRMTQ